MGALRRTLIVRLVQAAGVALAVSGLCFVLMHALPGDAAESIAAARFGIDRLTPEAAARVRAEAGLDQPLALQYARWFGQLLRGDLGRSLVTRKPVADELAYHFSYTLRLGLAGFALSLLLALPLGVAAGRRPGGFWDAATLTLATGLAATPTFLLGLVLVSLFAIRLQWLPPAGFASGRHMVLPAITLALGLAAVSARVVRNAVAETWQSFHMTFARLKGLRERTVVAAHGLRNTAIPVVAFTAVQLTFVIDGFVVIETMFGYPGIGDLLVKSLLARDIPVVQGATLAIGLMFTAINLAADLACLWLDPRQRILARGR